MNGQQFRSATTGRFEKAPTVQPDDIFEPEASAPIQPRKILLIDAFTGQRLDEAIGHVTQPDELVTPVPPRLRQVQDNAQRLLSRDDFGHLGVRDGNHAFNS
jgi:hypothetical protein